MSQQINLFNPIFLKQKKYFSALTMAQGLAMILVGSIAVVVYARVQLSVLEMEAASTAAQLKTTKAQLAKISVEYAPRNPSKALEEEIRRLQAVVRSQQQAYDVVQKGDFGNTKGYSEYFRAFSRQIMSGLWLTGFSITGDGSNIELRGRAMQAELVPAYLGRLKKEPVMQGKSFAALVMSVPERDASETSQAAAGASTRQQLADYVEFRLASSVDSPVGESSQGDAGATADFRGASRQGK